MYTNKIQIPNNCLKIIVGYGQEGDDSTSKYFRKISDENCEFLGLDPKYARPEWMIFKHLA